MIFFYWAAMYVYVPILPVYARGLGASLTMVGLLVGAYGFSQMVLRIPIGILSDRWGRRRPFIALGFVAAGLGAIGLSLASSPELLVVCRAVVGISAATWVASTVLFTGYFGPGETTRAIGLLSFVTGIAQLVATAVGGRIADDLGWRAPFLVAAALAVVGLVLTFGVRENRSRAAPPTLRRLVAVGTVRSLLAVSLIAALVQYASWATTYAFVPLYADALGASRTELGLLTAASLVLYTLTNLAVAPLAFRLGARRVTLVGLGLMASSILVVPYLHGLGVLALSQAVGGVGRGLASTLLMSESIRTIDQRERATAMGVFQAVYAIGMFVGPATAGLVGDALGLTGAFWVSALLLAIGTVPAATVVGREPARQAVA